MRLRLITLLFIISILFMGCSSTKELTAPKEENKIIQTSETDKQEDSKEVESMESSGKEQAQEQNQVQNQEQNEKQNQETEVNDQDDQNEQSTEVQLKYFVTEKAYIRLVEAETIQTTDKDQKIALITIDDAPSGKEMEDGKRSTEVLLDILDKYEAKAIWFVNGHYAEKNPDLIKEIYERGHIIGNHTWWHENLSKTSPEKTREEIISVNDYIEELIGVRPVYFRAPFGVNSEEAYKILKEEQMQAMNWTWGSLDWELKTPEEIEKNVVDNIHNGANLLFHDKTITAEALDGILQKLTEQGYKFVVPTEVVVKE